VLCQFRRRDTRPTLADLVPVPGVYPAGRLDHDSEGLVVLTSDGALQHALSHPGAGTEKVYLAQIEGVPAPTALAALAAGVPLGDRRTRPARIRAVPEPRWLWPRVPPIRHRLSVPTAWLELGLREGMNRQVRRMTAAVGHPTLRLIRIRVGPFTLGDLAPGEWREVAAGDRPGA